MTHRLISLLTAVMLALSPLGALAHVGHDAPGLHVVLERVDRQGPTLQIVLLIENGSDDAVLLAGFSTDLGRVSVLEAPTKVARGNDARVVLALEVEGDMPGVFTLIADFGPVGSGPVLIFTGA